jgi:hypothetical protein
MYSNVFLVCSMKKQRKASEKRFEYSKPDNIVLHRFQIMKALMRVESITDYQLFRGLFLHLSFIDSNVFFLNCSDYNRSSDFKKITCITYCKISLLISSAASTVARAVFRSPSAALSSFLSDSLGRALASPRSPAESLGRALASPANPAESFGRALASLDNPAESSGRALTSPNNPAESLGRALSSPCCLAGLFGRTIAIPWCAVEWIGRALASPRFTERVGWSAPSAASSCLKTRLNMFYIFFSFSENI